MRPIATQSRSYRYARSPVGAALCRDGLQSSPRIDQATGACCLTWYWLRTGVAYCNTRYGRCSSGQASRRRCHSSLARASSSAGNTFSALGTCSASSLPSHIA
ncbi:hypothetical protein BC89_09835 [Pseudomonas monteilii]|nr:hypothetical protein BC89_09835 [Pseudomonas monteilii]